ELIRQFEIPGGVFVLPQEDQIHVLVAAAIDGKLYVFDPRLGLPIAGKATSVATLEELRAQPQLGEPHGYSPEQVSQLSFRAIIPPTSLAPRMRFLEQKLAGQRRDALSEDLDALTKTLAPLDGEHQGSNGAADGFTVDRSLIQF